MDESFTVEDVLIVGLRKLAREKIYHSKNYGNTKEKMDKLKQAIVDLGGDPIEILQH